MNKEKKDRQVNEIIFFCKTPSDTRHTASAIGWIKLPTDINAALVARLINDGELKFIAQKYPNYEQKGLLHAAIGHGVTIKYANGRLREVK